MNVSHITKDSYVNKTPLLARCPRVPAQLANLRCDYKVTNPDPCLSSLPVMMAEITRKIEIDLYDDLGKAAYKFGTNVEMLTYGQIIRESLDHRCDTLLIPEDWAKHLRLSPLKVGFTDTGMEIQTYNFKNSTDTVTIIVCPLLKGKAYLLNASDLVLRVAEPETMRAVEGVAQVTACIWLEVLSERTSDSASD